MRSPSNLSFPTWMAGSTSILLCLVAMTVVGCSLSTAPSDQARVSISFPGSLSTGRSLLQGSGGTGFLIGTPDALTLDDFNCYGLNVTGPEIPVNAMVDACTNPNTPYPGVIGGLVPVTGGTLDLLVPAGVSRTFQLFAVQSHVGCPSLTDVLTRKIGSADIGIPYEVGRATLDVLGDTTVNIKAAYDATNKKQVFCPAGIGVPTRLSLTGPSKINTTDCAPYTVEADDSTLPKGLPVALNQDLAITITGIGSGAFYLDAACALPVSTGLKIPAKSSSQRVYLKATAPSSLSLLATAPGILSSPLAVTVNSLLGTHLAFSVQPSGTGTAGSALALQPQVSVLDAFNNLATGGGNPVTLAAYTDAACTVAATGTLGAANNPMPSSGGIAAFSGVSYTKAEILYLKASSAGLTSACSTGTAIAAAAPAIANSTIVGSGPVLANGVSTSTITMTLKDAAGNPVAGTVPTFTASGTGNSFAVSSATDANGVATSTMTSTVAEVKTLALVSPINKTGGTVTFTGNSATKLAFSVQPPPTAAAGVVFASPPQVQVQDSSGTLLSSATNPITVTAYTDAACSTTAASGTLAATNNPVVPGGGIATFAGVSYTKAEIIFLKAAATGLTPACSTAIAVSASSPVKLAFTTQPGSTNPAGSVLTTQPVVAIQDAYGNGVSSANASVYLSAYADPACTGFLGQFNSAGNPVVTSGGVASFSGLSVPASGTLYLRAQSSNSSYGFSCSANLNLTSSGPTLLNISGNNLMTTGSCSNPYTVQTTDGVHQAINVAAPLTINLGTTGSGGFFSDPACTSAASSVTIPTGANSQTFYYKNNGSQAVNIVASSSGLTTGTQEVATNTSSSGPVQLTVDPSSYDFDVGACTSAFQVTVRNGNWTPVNASSPVTANLTSDGSTTFYNDSGCTTAISNIQIAVGTSSQSFYLREGVPHLLKITAQDGSSILKSGQNGVAIRSSTTSPVFLGFDQNHQNNSTTGQCQTRAAIALDYSLTPVRVASAVTVNLSSPGSVVFYSDLNCTTPVSSISISANTSLTQFSMKDAVAESTTISAVDSSAALLSIAKDNLSFNTGNTGGGGSQLGFNGPINSTIATCSGPYNVQSRDGSGNPLNTAAPLNVALSIQSGSGGAFYSDSGCTSGAASVPIAMGTSTSANFYFKASSPAMVTFQASGSGYNNGWMNISNAQNGTPTQLVLGGPQNVPVNGCQSFQVSTRDSGNAPTNVPGATSITLSGPGAFYSDGACGSITSSVSLATGASMATFFYKNTSPGSVNLGASAGGITGATFPVVISSPGVASQLGLNGNNTIGVGSCNSYIVSVKDVNNAPTGPGTSLTVSLTGAGMGNYYSDAACTSVSSSLMISGATTQGTVYFKDPSVQGLFLSATAPGFAQGGYPVNVIGGSPVKLTFAGPAGSQNGACTMFTVQTRDSSNNLANVGANTIANLSGQASGAFFSTAGCGTSISSVVISTGTNSQNFWFKDSFNESTTFVASNPGAGLTNASQAITVFAPIAITPSAETLAVGNSFTFAFTGGLPPVTYSLFSGSGSINISTGLYTAPGTSGTATVRVTDNQGGYSDANVTINPALTMNPPTKTVAVNATSGFSAAGGVPPYNFSILSGSGSIIPSSGVYTAPSVAGAVTLRVTDNLGNQVSSAVTVYQPGMLFPGLGGGGLALNGPSGMNSLARGIVIQTDGKIVVGGYSGNGSTDTLTLERFLPNGNLDASFGSAGTVQTSLGSGNTRAYAVALDGNQNILVAGSTLVGSYLNFLVARYTPAGSLDPTFHSVGYVTSTFGAGHAEAAALKIQSDGMIVVGGYSTISLHANFTVARFTGSGSLDTSFNSTGSKTFSFGSVNDYLNGLALDSNGSIVVAGSSMGSTYNRFAIARLTSLGALDPSFNSTGQTLATFGAMDDVAYSVAVDASNRIYAAGYSNSSSNGKDVAVIRLSTSGTPDPSYGTSGKQVFQVSPAMADDVANAITVDSSNFATVAGYTNTGTNGNDFFVGRLTPSGLQDSTFGPGGRTISAVTTNSDMLYALALDPLNNHAVVAGSAFNAGFQTITVGEYWY